MLAVCHFKIIQPLGHARIVFTGDLEAYKTSTVTMLMVTFFLKVLSVTYVRSGTALDTIPPYVEFGGTLRSLTTEGLHYLRQRLKEVYTIP
jgi:hypothetical protein